MGVALKGQKKKVFFNKNKGKNLATLLRLYIKKCTYILHIHTYINIYILYIKNNKDLLYITGYSIFCDKGKESENGQINYSVIYIELNHCAIHLKQCKSTILSIF